MAKIKTPALTENELIDRLKVRYTEKTGNGEAWAFIPQVRSAAAFDSRRTIDAYAMSLWPSRGLSLTSFEIKSSRSDWQRELKNPAKAEEFCKLSDYFYLVVGDKSIVHPGELPETWGLLVPHGKGLRAEVEAPRLRPADGNFPPQFGRSYLAALLRSACAVGKTQPRDIREAEQRAVDRHDEANKDSARRWKEMWQQEVNRIREFEQASGLQIRNAMWPGNHTPDEVGKTVKAVLHGDYNVKVLHQRLERLCDDALSIAEFADARLPSEKT
jgi:hypothetical protein